MASHRSNSTTSATTYTIMRRIPATDSFGQIKLIVARKPSSNFKAAGRFSRDRFLSVRVSDSPTASQAAEAEHFESFLDLDGSEHIFSVSGNEPSIIHHGHKDTRKAVPVNVPIDCSQLSLNVAQCVADKDWLKDNVMLLEVDPGWNTAPEALIRIVAPE